MEASDRHIRFTLLYTCCKRLRRAGPKSPPRISIRRPPIRCSYDVVLCTQVLEHWDNPQRIVNECHRVLLPGGTLIVTVPSVYPVHGYPADNWRFMPDGLRYLLRASSELEVLGELDVAASLASVIAITGTCSLAEWERSALRSTHCGISPRTSSREC